jgi:hypothetical protein
MLGKLLLFVLLFISFPSFSQGDWNFLSLSPLPDPTAFNVLTSASVGQDKFVYSFGGVTTNLTYENVHQKIYKYHISLDKWELINAELDTVAKFGYVASFVNNRVYLIGGSYIDETSIVDLASVNVYNPFSDTLEPNANPLPVPVSEHQQFIWRDSLIYVVSGWSNGNLTNDVQVFNPFFNVWELGTPLPESQIYVAAGGSGYVIKDTIYYWAGANSADGELTNYLRKGVINPDNPLEIEWSFESSSIDVNTFRPLASGHSETVFWFGGTRTFYELGTASWNEEINPKARILMYGTRTKSYELVENTPFAQFGVTGLAKLGGGNWVVAGGIDSLQNITNRTFLINNISLSDWDLALQPPRFDVLELDDHYLIRTENIGRLSVFDATGKRLYFDRKHLADKQIDKAKLNASILFFVFDDGANVPVTRKRILVK